MQYYIEKPNQCFLWAEICAKSLEMMNILVILKPGKPLYDVTFYLPIFLLPSQWNTSEKYVLLVSQNKTRLSRNFSLIWIEF